MSLSTPRQSFASHSTATLVSTPRPSSASTVVASSRPSTATNITHNSDTKRQQRAKETQFQIKYGHKHHTYGSDKAPYPVSYDRSILELEALDAEFFKWVADGNVSTIPAFKNSPPERTLDLGCGGGSWVINAAKKWPECEFVGFDLVNVQLPLGVMKDPALEGRIQWTHGNFLTTRLPFDDDEFDYVHISGIARAVPESKWDFIFAEVNRVLMPGGAVEIIEDDISFPVLPRWFTAPLRARTKRATSVHYPQNALRPPPTPTRPQTPPSRNLPPHDHALLEALFNSVFENRFINMRPSAILPIYFTTYFRQVQSAPVTNFPMPPVPPPQPLPQPLSPNASGVDMLTSSLFNSSPPATRPVSLSFSSTVSGASMQLSESLSTESTIGSVFGSDHAPSESFSSAETDDDTSNARKRSMSMPRSSSSPKKQVNSRRSIANSSTTDSTSIGSVLESLVPNQRQDEMKERSLAMHLYRSFQGVMGVQESMWEELKDWVRNKADVLTELGWDDEVVGGDSEEENHVRLRFERLLKRYESDMLTRISFWCSLTETFAWGLPPKEPLTKAEHIEEEGIHKAIKEAMESASDDDLQTPCRSSRLIIGFKKIRSNDEEEFEANS